MIVYLPMTVGQRSLYQHHRFYPNDTAYNLTFLTHIKGPLDVERLVAAIEGVVNDNDTFKVDFVERNQTPVQRLDRTRTTTVEIIERDVTMSPAAFEQKVVRAAEQLQRSELRPSTWPLYSGLLFVSGSESHYLLTSVPHLIADGYSYSLCLDAISARYNDGLIIETKRDDVAPLRLARNGAGRKLQSDRTNEYFRQELRGFDSLEISAITQRRDADGGIRGSIRRFEIPREPVDSVLAEMHASPSRFFLCMYAYFLIRLLGTRRIVLGYAVPNRSSAEKTQIGCFVNTVPVVLDIARDASLADISKLVEQKLFRLHRYQGFDPETVDIGAARMNCLFTLYGREFNYVLSQCTCTQIPVFREHLPAEIRLTVETRADCYSLVFDVGTFFDEIDVEGGFRAVLEYATANPSLNGVPAAFKISRMGRWGCLNDFATTGRPRFRGVMGDFEAIVKARPPLTALRCGEDSVSYDVLNALANRMARYLAAAAGQSPYIVLSVEKSIAAVAAILAILKLGKCYVPIDPRSPPERIRHVLAELDGPLVIAQTVLPSAGSVVLIEGLVAESQRFADTDMNLACSESDTAYLIYTSGSTGSPKGVALSHGNLRSLIQACDSAFDFRTDDVWTLFHSFSFDYSIWEIFGSLVHGATLVIVDYLTTQDPRRFYELLCREKVTILNHTPSMFRTVIAEDLAQAGTLNPRYLFLGGESLLFSTLKEWVKRHPLPQSRIVNLYGPTEATVLVTYHEVCEADLERDRSIIGRPIDSALIEILNPDGDVAMAGVPGEIAISGAGVAHGYFKREEATAERFEFGAAGVRFRTGDLGKLLSDGTLKYLGRMDRQVKVRGFRVEPAEIETALRRSGMVADCAVDAFASDPTSDARLVAYVVPLHPSLTELSLRDALKEMVPAYMIPSLFVQIAKVPTTIGGKVDFTELAKGVQQRSSGLKGTTEIERWVYSVVAQKVKHDNFEISDNLFDIGLASLDIVDLVGTMRKRARYANLSVVEVFEHATVQALARHLESLADAPVQVDEPIDRARARHVMLEARRSQAASRVP
jgi:amino acid adenylation domain-containing protein